MRKAAPKKAVIRKKNAIKKYRIYSTETKKYMTGSFSSLALARGVAKGVYDIAGTPIEIRLDGNVIERVGKIAPRKSNPVKPHASKRQQRVISAIQLFQRFRVADPQFVDEINFELHDVMMKIGVINAIEYDTVRNGKKEYYRHEFSGNSRPDLAASWNGKQLYVLGGSYNFTADGIVDFNPKTGKEIR